MYKFEILKKALLFSSAFFLSINLAYAKDLDKKYALGYQYSLQGEHTKAFKIMLTLAKQNYSIAKHNVAISYLNGLGVKKNIKKATFWLKLAANDGVLDAQNELALSYYLGRGIVKKIKTAEKLWLTASKRNDEYAQFNLASLYLEQHKKQSAIYWFKQAYKNNHPKAQAALLQLNINMK